MVQSFPPRMLAASAELQELVRTAPVLDALPALADELLAMPVDRRPRVVWLQTGVRHDEVAERLTAAGMDVVQDRCLGVYVNRYV